VWTLKFEIVAWQQYAQIYYGGKRKSQQTARGKLNSKQLNSTTFGPILKI